MWQIAYLPNIPQLASLGKIEALISNAQFNLHFSVRNFYESENRVGQG